MNTTQQNNRLIAEFMGAISPNNQYEMYGIIECIEDGINEQHFFEPKDMKFHTSWDWLMEVVERIESLHGHRFDVEIRQASVRIYDSEAMEDILEIDGDSKIDTVYQACIEFIQEIGA